jgi:mitochondrial fission protein ELM1
LTCWVVSEANKIGTLNQCIGVAEALDLSYSVKKIKTRLPWRLLPPQFWLCPLSSLDKDADGLSAPWPDLIIAGGRGTVAPTAHIRRQSLGKTKVIQILDPKVSTLQFDCVIAPYHDHVRGSNVVEVLGALHRVTPQMIEQATTAFAPRFKDLKRPVISVLIGGSNKYYTFTEQVIDQLIHDLTSMASRENASLALTVSRRTPEAYRARIKAGLQGYSHYLWDNEGDNPYFALLGVADKLVVTCDSVAMISEACSTGKPVYVYELPSKPQKFSAFHEALYAKGHARPFNAKCNKNTLDSWPVQILDEKNRILETLKRYL